MREGEVMKLFKKSFSALLLACSLAAMLGSSFGCNTVHGLGQDIERGGEKTQDAADSVKRRL
jgi:predicted small secreted protein